MIPIPNHLKGKVEIHAANSSERNMVAWLKCCDNFDFEVKTSQNGGIVNAVCKKCKQEISVYDARKHGYDAYVTHSVYHLDFLDESIDEPMLYQKTCKRFFKKCDSTYFHIRIGIVTDHLYNIEEENEMSSQEIWENGFHNIYIKTECCKCKKIKLLMSHETA